MYRPRINLKRAAVLFNPLKKVLGDFDIDIAISTAVVSRGPAAAYALVWEYGNIRQTKKGPKTVLGVDPESGEAIWLTIQAPSGYVRIWKPLFKTIIFGELGKVKFGRKDTRQQLVAAWDRIGQLMTEKIRSTAPVDKGDLKGSITWTSPTNMQKMIRALKGVKGF